LGLKEENFLSELLELVEEGGLLSGLAYKSSDAWQLKWFISALLRGILGVRTF